MDKRIDYACGVDAVNALFAVGGFTNKHQAPVAPKTVGVRYFQEQFGVELPKVVKVIYNDPATVVFWSDNTKTVVKCGPNDTFNPEVGLAMAVVKKYYADNNTGEFHRLFKKFVPKEKKSKKASEKPNMEHYKCATCKHYDASAIKTPCDGCATKPSRPEWEAKAPVPRNCTTCEHNDKASSEDPCDCCLMNIAHPKWEAKAPVPRNCTTCAHCFDGATKPPCLTCIPKGSRPNWEAKSGDTEISKPVVEAHVCRTVSIK